MAARTATLASYETPPAPSAAKSNVTVPTTGLSPSVDVAARAADSTIENGFEMAQCLARVRERDEDAARLLLNHLYPLVLKLVRAHLPRRTSEEDLAHIVFMKVFAKIEQFSGTVP